MISGIDEKCDIDVYLSPKEIAKMQTETLQGVLIKLKDLKQQGVLQISHNSARSCEHGSGIGIDYTNFRETCSIDLFVASGVLKDLKARGVFGIRHSMRDGSKVTLYDISKLGSFDKGFVERLEFYRDNRAELK